MNRRPGLYLMMPVRALACLALILLSVSSAFQTAAAQKADPRFETLKADFLTLRNRDPQAQGIQNWLSLGARFEAYAKRFPSGAKAPDALFHVALIYERLFEGRADDAYIQRAIDALTRITESYPGDLLADDAWLKKGDLHASQGMYRESRKCFEKIISSYPRSDMLEVTKARLSRGALNPRRPSAGDEDGRPIKKPPGNGARAVVVLDPGHGGEDFGAVGRANLLEKDVTLAVALEIEKQLVNRIGAKVQLTRRIDLFVPLSERTAMANDLNADIFVSLHTNASPHGRSSGVEVYYLDNTQDKASKLLAERENKFASAGSGAAADLQFMLSDLIQNAKLDESIRLAHMVESEIVSSLTPKWGPVRALGVKKGPFFVLIGAHMPCVLVELFFIDNPEDGKRLAERTFRKDAAVGIARGIERFVAGK